MSDKKNKVDVWVFNCFTEQLLQDLPSLVLTPTHTTAYTITIAVMFLYNTLEDLR